MSRPFTIRGMTKMMRALCAGLMMSAFPLVMGGCAGSPAASPAAAQQSRGIVGAWLSKVRFASGAFASVKDLEFLYVFNEGGTMNESSNYDASPPVPPAYGIWRQVSAGQF